MLGFLTLLLATIGCFLGQTPGDAPVVVERPPSGLDTGTDEVENTTCADLELPVREFSSESPANLRRHQPAGDFSVPLRDGSTWTLSERWSGCESYIFLPHWLSLSSLNNGTFWTKGLKKLMGVSPVNAHYFFVVGGSSDSDSDTFGSEMRDRIDSALASKDDDEREWWEARLHVVDGPSDSVGGLVGDLFAADIGMLGFAIDREQKIRTLGSMAAVEAQNSELSAAGEWPWERRVFSAGYEAEYFNFEAERQARLDAVDATVIEVFGGDVIAEYEDGTLSLPDAATMAGFDTLEIDVVMECQDPDGYELGNCGAWDYIAHLWLMEDTTETWLEMGRFITTYHRESRWVLDASHALAWLQDGGDRTIRYSWAPSWNTQPTAVTLSLRLSNTGKAVAPREAFPLFSGGAFNTTYNDRDPVEVEVPGDAEKVEIVAIITGHGMDTGNCAEFCDHGHHFTVGSETFSLELDEPGNDTGCAETVGTGTVPNQGGTWWFGRGGWCPGRRVDPFVVDVTGQVSPGGPASVAYEATLNGGAPYDDAGTITMHSWLVVHR